MQDVRAPQKKSIRDINLTRVRGKAGEAPVREIKSNRREREEKKENLTPPPPREFSQSRMGGAPPWFFKASIGAAIVLAIVSVVSLFTFFGNGARVSISLKERVISVNDTFSFGKENGEIPYEIMTLSKEASKSVPTTGEKEVERKASGTIIIYNDYSSASQRLIKNTRFETPEGLVYRIDSSVTVPGQKTINGEKTPGSVEALVYADSAGDQYNIGLSDFIVPGFKGDPRFDKFYARSKTPMTGGFSGIVKTASVADIESAEKSLSEEMTLALKEQAKLEIPQGYVTFEPFIFIDSERLSDEESSDVKIRLTLRSVIVAAETFGNEIASRTIAEFDRGVEKVTVLDPSSLSISLSSPDVRPWESPSFKASISGTATLGWSFDETSLKEDLSGTPKARMAEILTAYPGIEKAEAVIRPFFNTSFPEDPSNIRIEILE